MEQKEKNTSLTKWIVLGVLCLITVLGFVFSGYLFGYASVFYQNISQNTFINTVYQKIPALIKTVQIVTIAYLLNWGLSVLLKKALAKTNRGKTVTTILTSFLKYFIAIVALLLILSAWGADTRSLLASAGILGLVIGLGAQSMIADILAGIFIVFESEFQVGDIIVIDGWRGTVTEIGIRTTKVTDWGGNIKIINNSAISSVINQTKELSLAVAYISIEYGQSIPEVEIIIKNNLERMKNAIPEIVEGPFYKGVDSLSDSSVDLMFMARCKEADLYGVQRAMRRELKLIFDENGINIPFPQVTISHLDDKNPSDHTKAEKREAQAFAAEQRELSKDMEEKPK